MRRIVLAALFALAASAMLAQDEPEWNSIIVRFTIDRDGKLHIAEQVQVDVPPNVQRLERTYWTDAEQDVTFDAITMYTENRTEKLEESSDLDRAHRFHESDWPGRVVWSVRDKSEQPQSWRSFTYVIESRVDDAVIPAWSIPRGNLKYGPGGGADLRERLRTTIPIWREALKNPRHRYLLNYQYDMPPPSTKGTEIQLQLYWARGWKPVHEITPDTIAKEIDRDVENPDRWRLTHLFEEDGNRTLINDDFARHAIRMAALIGFPIVGLLFWLAYVIRELLRRRGGEDGEQLARDVVFKEAPEVIEAYWSGTAPYVTIEQFLRRLERERKMALTIDETRVTIRLLVSREQLPAYEQVAIYMLMPEGWETTSDEIRKRHEGKEFNPSNVLSVQLDAIADAAKRREQSPWYSRLTSFVIFLTGVYWAVQEMVRYHRDPAVLFAGLIACSLLTSLWPSQLARKLVRDRLVAMLLLLIPLAIMTVMVVYIHFAAEMPPGYYASAGFSLMLLGAYNAILASSATRGSREFMQLVRARLWLKNELKSPMPRLRADALPWLVALGLKPPPAPVDVEEEEDWGEALMTEAP